MAAMTQMSGQWSLVTRRGTLTLEYAMLTAIVVAALLGMSVYVKRALEGRWRDVGDQFGHGQQYEPGVTIDHSGPDPIRVTRQ